MRQYASTHIDPGEVPAVEPVIGGRVLVAVDGGTILVARPDHLRAFCASIIAQIDAIEGGDAA